MICYYHEELTVLLRTLHSVLDRTDDKLLKEIIVVNDHSDIDIDANVTRHLQENSLQSKVKTLTPPERSGLIRARLFGAKHATGQVLVFLDRCSDFFGTYHAVATSEQLSFCICRT